MKDQKNRKIAILANPLALRRKSVRIIIMISRYLIETGIKMVFIGDAISGLTATNQDTQSGEEGSE